MKTIIRVQYRAALRDGAGEEALGAAVDRCAAALREQQAAGALYTAGLFRHERMLFLYMELVAGPEARPSDYRRLPETWLAPLTPCLSLWPEREGDSPWAYMLPVFWTDEPRDYGSFVRKQPPEGRCGRIAVLYPEKAMSYICHHQAIAAEGLLVGDRYQFISVHEDILFSYFETPRDRERVNLRRSPEPSREIERWEAVDPDSHFRRFPQAPDQNFLVIPTLLSL